MRVTSLNMMASHSLARIYVMHFHPNWLSRFRGRHGRNKRCLVFAAVPAFVAMPRPSFFQRLAFPPLPSKWAVGPT